MQRRLERPRWESRARLHRREASPQPDLDGARQDGAHGVVAPQREPLQPGATGPGGVPLAPEAQHVRAQVERQEHVTVALQRAVGREAPTVPEPPLGRLTLALDRPVERVLARTADTDTLRSVATETMRDAKVLERKECAGDFEHGGATSCPIRTSRER